MFGPEEVRAMLTSFAFFFFLLSSYFVLRPIRDAVAAASGVSKLPWLFAGTLTVTLLFNPLFSALVVRFPMRRVIPISYHFFVVNISRRSTWCCGSCRAPKDRRSTSGWAARSSSGRPSSRCSTRRSSGASWPTSFRSEQAKRLFGFIGVGGTLGSIIGSAVTATLAPKIGAVNLLLVSAALLEIAILTVVALSAGARRGGDPATRRWSSRSAARRTPRTMTSHWRKRLGGFLERRAVAVPARHLRVSDPVYDRLDVPLLRAGGHRRPFLRRPHGAHRGAGASSSSPRRC